MPSEHVCDRGPLVQERRFSEAQHGLIGFGLLYACAAGKFMNGFLTDRANTDHLLTELVHGRSDTVEPAPASSADAGPPRASTRPTPVRPASRQPQFV